MIQKMISNGHTKDQILNEYSFSEIRLFYEKILKHEMRKQADFIEGVIAGVGGSFGGSKEVLPMINQLRK